MSKIFKIFGRDVKGLTTNFFALVVALGLCVIPSLYAWFNIYSNWDPYANTGNVKIAVVSCDSGYTKKDGEYIKMGDSIIDNLKDNDKLGWQFPENKENALDSVKKGEYYAAIIIGEDFSESMYNCLYNGMEHPTVTYYENSKKNAVASKITDSGRSSLQESINTEFVDVVVTTIMGSLNDISGEENVVIKVSNQLKELDENLDGYSNTINSFISSNASLAASIEKTRQILPDVKNDVNDSLSQANNAGKIVGNSAEELIGNINTTANNILSTIDNVSVNFDNIHKALENQNISRAQEELNNSIESMNSLISQSETLKNSINGLSFGKIHFNKGILIDTLDTAISMEKTVVELLNTGNTILSGSSYLATAKAAMLAPVLSQVRAQMPSVRELFSDKILSNISELNDAISKSVDSINGSVSQLFDETSGIDNALGGLSSMVLTANTSLEGMQSVLENVQEKLKKVIEKLDTLQNEDIYQTLKDIVNGDPDSFGAFFSEPVQVTTVNVYETANYGSAVTPFYTTLALWVGALVLAALVKVHVDYKEDEFKNLKPYQAYFGRFLIFYVCGQIQTVIVVLGDLYLLKVQCLNKGLFFLAASVASFTFSILIYTLVLSFGDMGKAIAVVMVVIQIAGSSGTYPIELLPKFFQNAYLYFPFPYSINAMRETISGMYANDYWIALMELMVFVAVSLLLGLVIRKPFVKLNHFMEKRIHDTKMM